MASKKWVVTLRHDGDRWSTRHVVAAVDAACAVRRALYSFLKVDPYAPKGRTQGEWCGSVAVERWNRQG